MDKALIPPGWTINVGSRGQRLCQGQWRQIRHNEGSMGFDSGYGSGRDLTWLIGQQGGLHHGGRRRDRIAMIRTVVVVIVTKVLV